jgi:hypothetical protein
VKFIVYFVGEWLLNEDHFYLWSGWGVRGVMKHTLNDICQFVRSPAAVAVVASCTLDLNLISSSVLVDTMHLLSTEQEFMSARNAMD